MIQCPQEAERQRRRCERMQRKLETISDIVPPMKDQCEVVRAPSASRPS
jgi:hypothetical protein